MVDLRTGEIHSHRREAYSTKLTGCAPGEECSLWRAFLRRITGGDEELEAFLQRMAGHALTGITRDHALFFLYGTGANGKSVFTGTLSGILGNYAKTAPVETFTVSSGEHHPTDLAGLQGARLVMAIETEDGRRWAESKIKALTGGDKIAARFMRADFFEFAPQFKLVVTGNHKPSLRSVDEAIRRRLHLVPFTVTIPKDERDPCLSEKLRNEWPRILRWMIDGCIAWQSCGQDPPAVVRVATGEYLESEDALGRWIDECCLTGPNFSAKAKDLYASWKIWSEAAGEHVGSQKRLSRMLEDRGYPKGRQPGTSCRLFRRIALRMEAA
jgi:putative DNA primase/helicase